MEGEGGEERRKKSRENKQTNRPGWEKLRNSEFLPWKLGSLTFRFLFSTGKNKIKSGYNSKSKYVTSTLDSIAFILISPSESKKTPNYIACGIIPPTVVLGGIEKRSDCEPAPRTKGWICSQTPGTAQWLSWQGLLAGLEGVRPQECESVECEFWESPKSFSLTLAFSKLFN